MSHLTYEGADFELGASIYIRQNKYMADLVKELGLTENDQIF